MAVISQKRFIADLRGTDVLIYGIDNAGKDLESWQKLYTFWLEYFKIANADLKEYSVLRDISAFSFCTAPTYISFLPVFLPAKSDIHECIHLRCGLQSDRIHDTGRND